MTPPVYSSLQDVWEGGADGSSDVFRVLIDIRSSQADNVRRPFEPEGSTSR